MGKDEGRGEGNGMKLGKKIEKERGKIREIFLQQKNQIKRRKK